MVNKKLYKEISEYVKLNELGDVDLFIDKLIKDAFTIEKFGDKPIPHVQEIKILEKETIIEKKEILPNKEEEDDLYNE